MIPGWCYPPMTRGSRSHCTLRLDRERAEPFETGVPGVLRFSTALDVRLFGNLLHLGYLVGEISPDDVKVSMTAVPDADPPVWLP